MKQASKCTVPLLVALSAFALPAAGENSSQAVVIGEQVQLPSRVLGQTRELLISTPPGYESGEGRYGVLYVLDGDVHFAHTVGSTRFLAAGFNNVIPELIVVAVANKDRNRDFTPPSEDPREIRDFPTRGGAEDFLAFLRDELVPWVDENYRTNAYRALAGHSLSGLFAVYALAREPDTFNAYIAISPSLWWNKESVIEEARDRFDSTSGLDAVLYMACGAEPLAENARHLADTLRETSPQGLRWSLDSMPNQTHMSIVVPAIYEGLKTIFDGWNVDETAFSMFETASIEEIDALYRQSGQGFGIDRVTPEVMVDNFENYLINHDWLDEAAELMLRKPERYPLVPQLVDQLLSAYARKNDETAAAHFLERLVETRPNSAIARERAERLGVDPESGE